MEKKDFFISYNKANKDWAKWIGETLEESDYSVYLQAWDIAPGDDFIEQMSTFLQYSENYLAVLSSSFWESEYCRKEFQTAFNAYLKGNIKNFLSVRVEDFTPDPLYETTVYIDLFSIREEMAAKKFLLNGVGNTINSRMKGVFPNDASLRAECAVGEDDAVQFSFPGTTVRNYSTIGYEKVRNIILLETGQNKKGDLFNCLVYDVLHSLGFGDTLGVSDTLFNVQQSGREIDMVLRHRTENRYALVESKALKEKIGGTDINKFVGAFDVARGKFEGQGSSVTGYFISRSGFTSTAIEQERERAQVRKMHSERSELILLGPADIVRELIRGNVLCSLSKAVNTVVPPKGETLFICDYVDLIASEYGWIWVLYYSTHPQQIATHFAFVHADGNQLLNRIAETLLTKAVGEDNPFSSLTYIVALRDNTLNKQAAKKAYFRYLENELGEIQFEGMPADRDASAVKVNLESIFVPLSFNYEASTPQVKGGRKVRHSSEIQSTTIHGILTKTSRAAILAKPGGGKSTLIRRIALAYAYPERRRKVDDGLPKRDWFPVYIRCRDLGENATKSIIEIIQTIVNRAEITSHATAFNSLIEDCLQGGHMLLLIDGLDEISTEKYRICFVTQLRTFVATYPYLHLIVTSRETGFRAVAGTLASYCKQYSIASLDEKQIRQLSLRWHQAILGESEQAKRDSNKVCDIIINDPRIIALAENPLLLTTLLFVKRWVGYLPTKKCRLYEEMIKLLLVTWNAVAHDRLDLDETEPQLAFVAHYMTIHGQQKITRSQLKQCIIQARQALPELLGYTQITPSKFIDQVEDRSSLLIQLGLEEDERGQLEPSYEFSHLSFQEYLTARAIVQSWVPDSGSNTLLSVVKQHMYEEQWTEVIPLAAVLAGRLAKPTIDFLVDTCENTVVPDGDAFTEQPEDIAALHLGNCIASEVPMSQELLEQAFLQVVRRKRQLNRFFQSRFDEKIYFRDGASNLFQTILNGKYGTTYREFIQFNLFHALDPYYIYPFSDAWLLICLEDGYPGLSTISPLLGEERNRQDKITGALLMMYFAFQNRTPKLKRKFLFKSEDENLLPYIYDDLLQLLQNDDLLSRFSAAWCIAWSGYEGADIIPDTSASEIADKLVELWLNPSPSYQLNRVISWALRNICYPSLHIREQPGLLEGIENHLAKPQNKYDKNAAVHLAILTGNLSRDKFQCLVDEDVAHDCSPYQYNTRFLKHIGYFKMDDGTICVS